MTGGHLRLGEWSALGCDQSGYGSLAQDAFVVANAAGGFETGGSRNPGEAGD